MHLQQTFYKYGSASVKHLIKKGICKGFQETRVNSFVNAGVKGWEPGSSTVSPYFARLHIKHQSAQLEPLPDSRTSKQTGLPLHARRACGKAAPWFSISIEEREQLLLTLAGKFLPQTEFITPSLVVA